MLAVNYQLTMLLCASRFFYNSPLLILIAGGASVYSVNNPSPGQQSPHPVSSGESPSETISQPPISAAGEVVPGPAETSSAVEGVSSVSNAGELPLMASGVAFDLQTSEAAGK